jgi:hypothetical protein
MNVEIGAEAALLPEKEYINGIAFAVLDDGLPSLLDDMGTSSRGTIPLKGPGHVIEFKYF